MSAVRLFCRSPAEKPRERKRLSSCCSGVFFTDFAVISTKKSENRKMLMSMQIVFALERRHGVVKGAKEHTALLCGIKFLFHYLPPF